jgi:hypothetical protein
MVAKEILRKRNSIFHAAMIEKTKAPFDYKTQEMHWTASPFM